MNSPVVGKRAHTAAFGWQKQSVYVLSLQPLLPSKGSPPGVHWPLFLLHPSSLRGEAQASVFCTEVEIFFSIFYLNRSDRSISADMQILQNRTKTTLQPYKNIRIALIMLESRVFSLIYRFLHTMHCYKSQESLFGCRKMFKVQVMPATISIEYKALKLLQKYFRTLLAFKSKLVFFS